MNPAPLISYAQPMATGPLDAVRPNAWRGLVALWPMMKGGGAAARDLSGSNNGGTLSGATWGPTGIIVDGVAEHVAVTNTFGDKVRMTIGVSVTPTAYSGSTYFADTSDGAAGFALNTDGASYVRFFCYTVGSGSSVAASGFLPTVNKKHLIVGTHDANNKIYVDGKLEATTASEVGHISGANLHICGEFDGDSASQGIYEYAFMYDRALSAAEISQWFALGLAYPLERRAMRPVWKPAARGKVSGDLAETGLTSGGLVA